MNQLEYLNSIAMKEPEKQKIWKRVPFLRGIIIGVLIFMTMIMTISFVKEVTNRSPKKLARLEHLCTSFDEILGKYGRELKDSNLRSINSAILSANAEIKTTVTKIRKDKYGDTGKPKPTKEDMAQLEQLKYSLEESLIGGMLDQNYPALVNYSNHTVLTILNELKELNQGNKNLMTEIRPLINTLETIGKSIAKHLDNKNQ